MAKKSAKQPQEMIDATPQEEPGETQLEAHAPFMLRLQAPVVQCGRVLGEAVNIYKNLFKTTTSDVENLYLKKARAANRSGDTARCVRFMEKAAEIAEEDAVFYELGVAYEMNAEFDEALRAYEKTINLNNEHARAHYRAGIVMIRQRDFKTAIKVLGTALNLEPDSAEVNYRLGLAHDRLKNYEKALEFFLKAVEIEPDFLQAYKNMALTYDSMDKHKEGLECLKRALEIEEEKTS